MASDVPKFIELYCQGDKATKNAGAVHDRSTRSRSTSCASRRRRLVELADKGGGQDALAALREGRRRVPRALAQVLRGAAAKRASRRSASKCDEIALQRGAGVPGGAPRREGDHGRARSCIDPKYKLDNTRAREEGDLRDRRQLPGHRGLRPRGRLVREVREGRTRRRENADKALSRRRRAPPRSRPGGRGDQGRATLQQELRRAKPAQTAPIAFAIGAHYAEQGRLGQGAQARSPARWALIDKSATLDVQVQAHATARRACYAKLNSDAQRAKTEYAQGRGALERPGGGRGARSRRIPGEDDGAKTAASARRSPPSARRIFFFAEAEAQGEVDTIKFPEYKGAGRQGRRPQAHQDQGEGLDTRRSAPRSRRSSRST